MEIIKCYRCPVTTEKTEDWIPYLWTHINRKTGDVHDSASVVRESEFWLCPECGANLIRKEQPHE